MARLFSFLRLVGGIWLGAVRFGGTLIDSWVFQPGLSYRSGSRKMELLFQKLPSLPTSIGLHLFFLSTLSNKLWFPVLFLTFFFGFYLSLPWGGLLVFLIWLLLVVSAPRLEGHLPWDQLTYFLDLNQDEVPDSLRREDLLPKNLLQKTYLEKPSGRGSPRLLSREWGHLGRGGETHCESLLLPKEGQKKASSEGITSLSFLWS